MKLLINASNLKTGGALQVTDSICRDLNRFPQHHFVVVISEALTSLNNIKGESIEVFNCSSSNNYKVLLTGRDQFLDQLVLDKRIDVVFSVFGPITWTPKVPHLCGFARPHLVLGDSPYFKRMSFLESLKNKVLNGILSFYFKRGVTAFFTENSYISEKWQQASEKTKVYTVTNYYNQVYDQPESWKSFELPVFDGFTFLCVTANYPHKNLEIAISISKIFKSKYPDFKFRFVFTIREDEYPVLPSELRGYFLFLGKVEIQQCPSLYQQADIMFQPTLLECFTAIYPEAMKMEVPIVTTDLDFARGLCGDAAAYYSPLDAEQAASLLYQVSTDQKLRANLVENGKKQLLKYDTYQQRTEKLINIATSLVQ